MDDTQGLKTIKKMYEKLNYFDQYGGSVVLFVIITIILIILISYCFIMINAQPIIDDWANQRCKPTIIPVAGFITHPEGVTATEYTQENFTYCTQNILSNITGYAIEPLTYITNTLNISANQIEADLQSVRGMFDKIRNMFQEVSQELMGRIMNVTIPLQQIIISFKDLMGKIQGTMTTGLFTLLGSYYTLQSLMGAIAQFIVTILIAFAAIIAAFWIIPFTWGVAISNTVIFVALSIPMIIILAFMKDVLHVQTGLRMPTIKCFDKDTLIKMADGTSKTMSNLKVGDLLFKNNEVTAIIKVETKGSIMYKLNNIIVSDTHIVNYQNSWIPVSKHPDAVQYSSYDEPFLYCLNTSNKIIMIGDYIFTDWDEVYNTYIEEIKTNSIIRINCLKDIHACIDGGFAGLTQVKLKNGSYKNIKDVQINDVLECGEIVYGLVEINGDTVNEQFKYNLGNVFIEGGPNLIMRNSNVGFISTLSLDPINKQVLINKHNSLYHLLTNVQSFHIDEIQFYDYNAIIDTLLEKSKEKLLYMKYV